MDIDPVDTKAIDDLMDTAALHRQTASTNMNAQSSRSHSIFTLYLEGINQELGARVREWGKAVGRSVRHHPCAAAVSKQR